MAQLKGVDAKLIEIINEAKDLHPEFNVQIVSGFRNGDKRQHGHGNAIDVRLSDKKTGKVLNNYQNADDFRQYEKFAQTARRVQQDLYPDMDNHLRWGGYFSGGKGNMVHWIQCILT